MLQEHPFGGLLKTSIEITVETWAFARRSSRNRATFLGSSFVELRDSHGEKLFLRSAARPLNSNAEHGFDQG